MTQAEAGVSVTAARVKAMVETLHESKAFWLVRVWVLTTWVIAWDGDHVFVMDAEHGTIVAEYEAYDADEHEAWLRIASWLDVELGGMSREVNKRDWVMDEGGAR